MFFHGKNVLYVLCYLPLYRMEDKSQRKKTVHLQLQHLVFFKLVVLFYALLVLEL